MPGRRRTLAYLAAPLFNDMERAHNAALERLLAPHMDVFLPQRDGQLLKELLASGWRLSDARLAVFQQDVGAIARAHVLIAVLDGRTVDEGVAFELGYARALGKFCAGLKTDDRAMLPSGDNPMILSACDVMCANSADLLSAILRRVSGQLVT